MTTHHLRTILGAPGLLLAVACGSASEAPPGPAAATPSTHAPVEPVAEATRPAPNAIEATPTAAPPAPPEPTPKPVAVEPSPAVPTPTLRTAAVRQGVIELTRQGDAPLVVIDGEPVAWTDGAFVRHPTGSKGLWRNRMPEDHMSRTLAAASLPEPLGAWTSSEHEIPRIASYYEVYRREGDQWRQRTQRKDLLVAYYTAFVQRDGALLALRRWTADVSQDPSLLDESEELDAKAAAREAKRSRALAKVEQEWVRIAGNEAVVCPEIPADTSVYGGVTTTDGTLLAQADERRAGSESEERVLLVWKPGRATAERIELPKLGEIQGLQLGSSGEWILLAGSTYHDGIESYLAVGRGSTLEPVPVSLPGRSSDSEVPKYVSGAARWPDGELWISISDPYMGQEGSMGVGGGDIVWRKPVDGAWQPVPLPKLGDDAQAPEHATALFWAADAVWIAIGAGAGYDGSGPTQAAVLTTRPGTAPPTVLPSEAQLQRERKGSSSQKKATP